MTAKHCVAAAEERGYEMFINRGWAADIHRSPDADMAILLGEYAGKALKLAKDAPKIGDAVSIQGFPYGLPRLVTSRGHMAARLLPLGPGYNLNDILDITVAGGNSGSPVFNSRGEVIGVLWGGFTQSPHSISVPWETIKRLGGSYFGR